MDKQLLDYMNKVTDYYTKPNRYLAQEVVDMFLKDEVKVKENRQECTQLNQRSSLDNLENIGTFHMDMDELEKWRNKNNSKFAIRSHLPINSHRKVIGKLIVFGKKVVRKCLKWYSEPIVEQQNEFNASVTASINAIYNNDIVVNQFMQVVQVQIEEMKASHAVELQELKSGYNHALQEIVSNFNAQIQEVRANYSAELKTLKASGEVQGEGIEEKLTALKYNLEDLNINMQQSLEASQVAQQEIRNTALEEERQQREEAIDNLRTSLEATLQAQHSLNQNDIKGVRDLVEKTQENINYITYKINKMKKEGIKVELVEAKAQIEEKGLEVSDQVELDYFLFENKFRGTEKSIKKNQEQYLDYYKDKENILDIGCGRGEFLELLTENNIPAKGIDVYGEFVEYCQDKGMEVVQKDALSYVKEQEDNSLGGIFMGQVAEHLENDYLLNLLASCYEKMQKGAYFISETPNPTNLSIFTSSFYLDPSHVKPVHPETFKFMLEYVGFKEIEIVYTDSSKPGYRLPLLNASQVENLEEFNSGINCITDMLMGSLDYAIIAKK